MCIRDSDYPYQLSTQTTNYQSVSEVKQLYEEPDSGELARIDWTDGERKHRYTADLFERPKFLQETTAPTGAEIGQATHLLLQTLDLSEEPTTEKINNTIEQMIEEELIREEMIDKIEVNKIINYFQTSFGKRIVQHFKEMEREVLFSLIMNANEVFLNMDHVEDSILIHGIIDGYFRTEDGLVLFDYKTDRVAYLKEAAEDELIKRYRGQLLLYKQALETITKEPVIEANIISLDLGETISIFA